MARTRGRWYVLAVVLLAVAVVAFSVALRPNRTVTGAAVATASTSPSSTSAGSSALPPPPLSQSTSTQPGAQSSSAPAVPVGDPDGAIGAETAGDPYYPDAGNGGYDVMSYQVDFSWDADTGGLSAVTTIAATVTQDGKLGRFSYDLQPTMTVSAVTVDDVPAGYEQHDAKLTITPTSGLATGAAMTVTVTYTGTPTTIANGTSGLADGGWYTTKSGGAAVLGEPFSASAWYPVNETPTDRASFGITAQVPTGWEVISNGLPVDDVPTAEDGYAVFGWSEASAMASYLTVLYIDPFTTSQDTSASGLPIINAYGPGAENQSAVGNKTSEYLDFLATKFGPYPFDSSGGIFLSEEFGFALETQTRPIYSSFANESTVVHELAHQWFGDDVTVERWADICLNECFASYAEWLWSENSGTDLDDRYRTEVKSATAAYWRTPLFDMGAGNEFGVVYQRGPVALHALRAELGDEKFNELLLSWIEEHAGGNASWADFEDLVDKISGKDESGFMNAWFRSTTQPADEYLWPGDLTP